MSKFSVDFRVCNICKEGYFDFFLCYLLPFGPVCCLSALRLQALQWRGPSRVLILGGCSTLPSTRHDAGGSHAVCGLGHTHSRGLFQSPQPLWEPSRLSACGLAGLSGTPWHQMSPFFADHPKQCKQRSSLFLKWILKISCSSEQPIYRGAPVKCHLNSSHE